MAPKDINDPSQLSFGPNSPRYVQASISFADIVMGSSSPHLIEPMPAPSMAASPVDNSCGASFFETLISKPLTLDFISIIDMLEDDHILIPTAIMENGSAPYERTLYRYFVGDRLGFNLVKSRTQDMWKEHGLCDIFINEDDVFFFKFENDDGMNYVLPKGIWKINGIPLFLRE